ncbi:hypothetical protein ElyMa_006247000 [Elysia marginata]|uniref:Ig-like domain-containing protein n=1 Tax=Elysia marginata TaxID=1093978 RepID=A0AAV4H9W2_9GAST|nr:hypothetical protein ElyMa_006247000 [Elysia marginata]
MCPKFPVPRFVSGASTETRQPVLTIGQPETAIGLRWTRDRPMDTQSVLTMGQSTPDRSVPSYAQHRLTPIIRWRAI